MKKTKVYIQYPWKFSECSYYKYLTEHPPKGIEFLNRKKGKKVITGKIKFLFVQKFKKVLRKLVSAFYPTLPNVHKLKTNQKYDLIHCAHCLSKNKDKPWIADIEYPGQFWIGKTPKNKEKIRKILTRKNCKKIIPWSEISAKVTKEMFPEIRDKVEAVYPATPLPKKVKRKNKKNITLLFVGRYFYAKGGLHALEAMKRLVKKYKNVNGIIISAIPDEIKRRHKNKKIKLYNLVPQKKLFKEIYPKSNIFIYPGYTDSFGFALTEAMGFEMPIVTVDGCARKEIVGKKQGYVIDKPKNFDFKRIAKNEIKVIEEMVEKTSKLIEDKKLREKMGKNARKEIEKGKFSIAKRNKQLKRIYEEAIK